MTTRRAQCACGKLTVTCEGEPVRISMCHCLECQKRTGSVFGVQARFPEDRVKIEGERKAFSRVADSGKSVTLQFCPTCGSTVCWQLELLPGFVAVAVGAFADKDFPAPRLSVYDERRPAWMPRVVEEELA